MPEVSTASGELTLRGMPDRQPPQIVLGPFAQDISATGAQIVWETDEPATGTVEFGTSASYGQTATAGGDPGKSPGPGGLSRRECQCLGLRISIPIMATAMSSRESPFG
jgi:hypothetical protein